MKKPVRVPFITTYNPTLANIHKVLRQKQPILKSTERMHEIFKETPVVAYRRSPNLRDLLLRAKLNNPANTAQPNHSPGTFRYNSKHGCLTCPLIDDGRTSYTFSNTGEVREVKQQMTCKSTNLTYMIECKRCGKQYIGETKRTLRERFTEHRQATNNPSHASALAAAPTHFNLPDHSIRHDTRSSRASTNIQYLSQKSKGGLSDTQGPNARTEWNEPTKWTLTV